MASGLATPRLGHDDGHRLGLPLAAHRAVVVRRSCQPIPARPELVMLRKRVHRGRVHALNGVPSGNTRP